MKIVYRIYVNGQPTFTYCTTKRSAEEQIRMERYYDRKIAHNYTFKKVEVA